MSYKEAEVGDIYLLVTPPELAMTTGFVWQDELQVRFGGQLVTPVHISCQRFVCPDPKQLLEFQNHLQRVTSSRSPFEVIGIELLTLYTTFRQARILKCRVELSTSMRQVEACIKAALDTYDLQPHFASTSDLVTVLTHIETELPQPVSYVRPLFRGPQLLLSQIVGQNAYVRLGQWSLAGSYE